MKKILRFKMQLLSILVVSMCFLFGVKTDNIISTSLLLKSDQLIKKEGKWRYFKAGNKIPVSELIENNYELLDLPKGVSSRIEKEDTDEFGMVHYLLKLEMLGIPIEDAFYTAHYSKIGDLLHIVGDYDRLKVFSTPTLAKISEFNAIEIAKEEFVSYNKVVSKEEFNNLMNELNNEEFKANKVFYHKNYNDPLELCFRIDISSEVVEKQLTIYVNAISGKLFKIIDYAVSNVANVVTVYNGTKDNVQVKWRGWPNSYYYLRDESKSTPIETRNSAINEGSPECTPYGFGNLDLVYKGDLNWPLDFKSNAGSSHWAAMESYNVFKNIYGRTYGTFSSSGGEIRVENNYTPTHGANDDYFGPFYEPSSSYDYIHIGNTIGYTNGFEGSLDVIAHEFTHGVMWRARGVSSYEYPETGEIMESFADIFAIMVEYYTLGQTDTIVGSNLIDNFKRSLKRPWQYDTYVATPINDQYCKYFLTNYIGFDVPTYYLELYRWLPGAGSSQAHINCSVQNYWFYLLANGGSQLGVTVSGIGLTSASQIAYRNMVYYFSLGDSLSDMRNASIVNAEALFGECSNEYLQVMNAWAAVGVGAAGTPCIHTEIIGPESLNCGEGGYYSANTHGGSGSYSYNWYVDYSYYSSASSIYLAFYPQYDSEYHNVSLNITEGNLSDSDDQSIYVYSCGQGELNINEGTLNFKIYPNPASSTTKVEINDDLIQNDEQYSIQIIDRNGRIVYSDKTFLKEFNLNTGSLQSGIYSTVIRTGKKTGYVKLIIE